MVTQSDDAVTLTYDSDLILVSVVPGDRPFFGWQPQDVIGTYFMLAGRAAPETPAAARTFLESLAQAGQTEIRQRFAAVCADGSMAMADVRMRIELDGAGRLRSCIGVVRPVTSTG